jgi:hypothetical protein
LIKNRQPKSIIITLFLYSQGRILMQRMCTVKKSLPIIALLVVCILTPQPTHTYKTSWESKTEIAIALVAFCVMARLANKARKENPLTPESFYIQEKRALCSGQFFKAGGLALTFIDDYILGDLERFGAPEEPTIPVCNGTQKVINTINNGETIYLAPQVKKNPRGIVGQGFTGFVRTLRPLTDISKGFKTLQTLGFDPAWQSTSPDKGTPAAIPVYQVPEPAKAPSAPTPGH